VSYSTGSAPLGISSGARAIKGGLTNLGRWPSFQPRLTRYESLRPIFVCFGLRISECLALKWSDIDWLNCRLSIERAIVRQRIGDVKTVYSGRKMSIDAEMLDVLRMWKQTTQFSANEDWMFASPVKLGRQPWSYDQVWRNFLWAASAAGIGKLGTHSMRHTYRSWLDAVGTPVAVNRSSCVMPTFGPR
jgi:integrase